MKLAILFLLISINVLSNAQTINQNRSQELTMYSKVLKEERVVRIYLPPSYQFTDHNYPVLYLLDGEGNLQHTAAAIDFLSGRELIPQTIVVAIYNVDRTRDFSPIHTKNRPTSGGADLFLQFIEKELIKTIDKKYRTSNFTTIAGHSFGGTFISYSLLEKPNLFDGYIALSPYLHYAENYVIDESYKRFPNHFPKKKMLYITVGNEPNYFKPLRKYTHILDDKVNETFDYLYVVNKNEDHGSIPYTGLYNGLRYIFLDWPISDEIITEGLDSVDKHYKNMQKKYGLDLMVPEHIINRLGYYYLSQNEVEEALSVFKENVKRNPMSPNVYDSLGEAYEQKKNLNQAEKNYQKAYELGRNQRNPNTSVFLNNLKRVKAKK